MSRQQERRAPRSSSLLLEEAAAHHVEVGLLRHYLAVLHLPHLHRLPPAFLVTQRGRNSTYHTFSTSQLHLPHLQQPRNSAYRTYHTPSTSQLPLPHLLHLVTPPTAPPPLPPAPLVTQLGRSSTSTPPRNSNYHTTSIPTNAPGHSTGP